MKHIINADDFGMSKSRNEAITQCFLKGLINQTTIMVNMACFEEAVELSKQYSFFNKVGLHLNLMEGKPLTEEIKLFNEICSEGHFNGNLQTYLRKKNFIPKAMKKAIHKEIEAQILKYTEAGFTLKHIDSHFHIHNEFFIYKITKPLCIKYHIKSMRILRNLMNKDHFVAFIKCLYKRIINHDIKKSFSHTDYFGSYEDYKLYYQKDKQSVEIMLHPDIINGELVDVINDDFVPLNKYLYKND